MYGLRRVAVTSGDNLCPSVGQHIPTDCTDIHWYSVFLCQSVLVGGWYYLPRGNIPQRLCLNHWMPRKCTETRDILHPCAARRNLNYLNQTYLHHSLDSLDFSTEGRRMLDSERQYSSVSIRGTYIPTDYTDLHWYSRFLWIAYCLSPITNRC